MNSFEILKDFDFFSFGLCYFGISTFHNKIATVQFKIISFFYVKQPTVQYQFVQYSL